MIGILTGKATAKALGQAQSQQIAQSQAAAAALGGQITISPGGQIIANSTVHSGSIFATMARTPIKDFTDEEILQEYLKRFSPLAQAMKEDK